MKVSRIGIAVVIAALGGLAFASSPVASSASPNQVPTWWHKAQTLMNATSLPPCGHSQGNFSDGANIDMSNEATAQSETSIAINPMNTSQIVGGSNEIVCLPMRAYFSNADGAGGSWGAVDLPLPGPISPNGNRFGSDPGVAWDTLGNVYYSYIVVFFDPAFKKVTGSEMAVGRSSDGGQSWAATFFNLNNGNGKFNDKPMITVDTNKSSKHYNTVYVAWDNASQRNGKSSNNDVVLVSSSTDHGITFSAPVVASPNNGGPAAVIGADPFVGPDGTLYVAWDDSINPSIQVAASGDGGATFGPAHEISPTLATFQVNPPAQALRGALIYPACAVTPGNTLFCSWSDATASDGMRVFVSHSAKGGASWSAAQRVSNPSIVSDQFNQWLAVDRSTGRVVLSWNDSRNDPTRHATDIFLAESTSTGFAVQQVTTSPTDETVAGAELGNQYGDYEFIAAANGEIHPVWTDRRASIAAVNGLDEEVFTATIKE